MLDALVVGAGPTGLSLAAQLQTFGIRFRLVDRATDRAHESRALAVQARTLELFQQLGLGQKLVELGNPSARLLIHFGQTVAAQMQLGGFGASDTRFPFILFVSQAKTEALLEEHLRSGGLQIERGLELIAFTRGDNYVRARLRHSGGREEDVETRYLVGCDGAHSAVRKLAGIVFEGDAYLQDFMLGDVEVDGPLEPGALHSFAGAGVAMFFPLGSPATWRVIAMSGGQAKAARHRQTAANELATTELPLDELQTIVDGVTGGGLRLRDPAWLTHFRLHHRQADRYGSDRVFLVGDAAHIHSPVGGQGMNTGIQDAWNLGWKLAMVAQGAADPKLLDSYEAERWPVGHFLLRYTDRVFGLFVRAMGPGRITAWLRRNVAARILPLLVSSPRLRAAMFRFVSELGIHYRGSPAVLEGKPRLDEGPRAGERLPDAQVFRDGRLTYLQQEVVGPHMALLLCGEVDAWDASAVQRLVDRHCGLLVTFHLTRRHIAGALVDGSGEVSSRLGVADTALYLVRPDGHICFRSAGCNLENSALYLGSWLKTHA
jgi:2-polyprenyl-6-methoxyphenol hydroxylase-like FAD-dependent oxidoreductase